MSQRGRKTPGTENVPKIGGERPDAPDDLNEFQQDLWTRIVDTKPTDWFTRDTLEHLRAYCATAWAVREMTVRMDELISVKAEIADIQKAEKVVASLTAKMMSVARSMRITQQSLDAAQAARKAQRAARPSWETGRPAWEKD